MSTPGDPGSCTVTFDFTVETPSSASSSYRGANIGVKTETEVTPLPPRTVSKYFAGGKEQQDSKRGLDARRYGNSEPGEDIETVPLKMEVKREDTFEYRGIPSHNTRNVDPLLDIMPSNPSDLVSSGVPTYSPAPVTGPIRITRRKPRRSTDSSASERERKRKETSSEDLSDHNSQVGPDSVAPKPEAKKKRMKRGYAPPEAYAHLNFVQDNLDYDLNIVFCGINPGQRSAGEGHHFANPRNGFWKCLHQGGLTETLIPPSEDHTLPDRFKLGITNLVDRPSAEMAELSMAERRAAVPIFLRKVQRWRPKIICMVGKGIWEDVFAYVVKAAKGKSTDDGIGVEKSAEGGTNLTKLKGSFEFDIQPVCLLHRTDKGAERTLFFVVPSTSGRVLTHQLEDKVRLFKLLHKRWKELESGTLDKRIEWMIRIDSGT